MKKDNKKLFNFLGIFDEDHDEEITWDNEFNQYLEARCAPEHIDILQWWSEYEEIYPVLVKMAKDKLAIMSTSVLVERLFSSAALVVSTKEEIPEEEFIKGTIGQQCLLEVQNNEGDLCLQNLICYQKFFLSLFWLLLSIILFYSCCCFILLQNFLYFQN